MKEVFKVPHFGQSKLAYLILICSLCVFANAQAQLNFPSTRVLKDSNVKTMRVYRQTLKYVDGPEKEREKMGEPDTTLSLHEVYYINDFGWADSIRTYRNYYYDYDGNDVVGYKIINHDGTEYQKGEITKTGNNEMVSRSWEYGSLKSTVYINSDSILTDQYFYNRTDTFWTSVIRFDPEKDLKTEHWRGSNGAYRIETYQWFTIDGKPSSFHHTLEEREAGKTKIITKEKTYELDSAGNVVNKYLGRFDDPYIFYNYFRRYQKFASPKFYSQDRFKEDHLVRSKIKEELLTFSGIRTVVRYIMEYDRR